MAFILDAVLGVVAIAILAIVVLVIVLFNGFVSRRNRVQDAWAQIDVQLKRRYDLIPNLINSVKGYMTYEKSVLTQVTQLRTSIMNGNAQDKAQANNQLSQALKSIFAVAENYPDLKASQNFINLQQQLMDTEDKIAFVRTSYNDYVLEYNNSLQEFPGNVFSVRFGFKKADFFQAPEEEKQNIKVDFSDVNNMQGSQPKAGAAQQKPSKK